METPICPNCPGGPVLLPGDDSYYVCFKCGYTSPVAATFFDERDEMLQQMDATERYAGLLKDNIMGGARLMRTSKGNAYRGQETIRAELYRQQRDEKAKEWTEQLATFKLGLPAHISARAYHVAESVIETLVREKKKHNRSIVDKYIHAACLSITAGEHKRVINHLEMSVASGLEPDKLRAYLAFCRKGLKVRYDFSSQATSYVEMVLRHIKAIIETPHASRLHNQNKPYPDETVHFLHLVHPVLLECRKMSTELSEMLASLSVNYARDPGISACAIVMAAMEGVTCAYTSQSGVIMDELAVYLPKASKFTIRERYLEILNVVFDLGQYLGDIGHPIETIPVWRHMVRRAPPRRHMFITFLPSVVRHWKALLACQRSQEKPPVYTTVGAGRLDGERLWKLLLPNKELPKPSVRGKKPADVDGDIAVGGDNSEATSTTDVRGADADVRHSQSLDEASHHEANGHTGESTTSITTASKKKGKRAAPDRDAGDEGNDDARPPFKRVREERTPEQKAEALARSKLLRRERDMKRRERKRIEAYGKRPTIALTEEQPKDAANCQDDDRAKDRPAPRHATYEAISLPDLAHAIPPTTGWEVEQRAQLMRNRSIYERRRATKSSDYRRTPQHSQRIVSYLRRWQQEHAGEILEEDDCDQRALGRFKRKYHARHLRNLLLSGVSPRKLPEIVFPTSLLMARFLLDGGIVEDIDVIDDAELFEEGELDGYICNAIERQTRLIQWHEDRMDQYIAQGRRKRLRAQGETEDHSGDENGEEDAGPSFDDAVNAMLANAAAGANHEIEWSDDEDDDNKEETGGNENHDGNEYHENGLLNAHHAHSMRD